MEKGQGAYKYQIVVDQELHQAIDTLIEERGMSKSAACRFLIRLGYDHYEECKALGIMSVSDMIIKLREFWRSERRSNGVSILDK